MPTGLLEDTLVDDMEATSLPEEEAAPDEQGETEPEQPASPYDGKSAEEIEAVIAERVKDAEARARQSEADKAAAKAARDAYERDKRMADFIRTGNAKKALADSVNEQLQRAAEAGRNGDELPAVAIEAFDQVVSSIHQGLLQADTEEWTTVANTVLQQIAPPADWRIPPELLVKAAQAQQRYGKDGWLHSTMDIMSSAIEAKLRVELRKEIMEELQVKNLETKNGRQPGPTGGRGDGPSNRSPEEALNEQGISMDERKKRWKEAYPGIPWPSRSG